MATATFFTTAKRHNSTLIPTGGTDLSVSLKNGCDLLAPTFYLDYASVPTWSMMQFAGRYYFITGITSLRQDYWQIDAEVDVLATYKAAIQATTAFVLYDATANNDIVDTRLAVNASKTAMQNNVILNENASAAGSYLCCVTGERSTNIFKIPNVAWLDQIISGSGATQGLDAYLSNEFPDTDQSPFQWLTDEDRWKNIGYYVKQAGKNLIGSGNNILSNIRSLIWVPWRVETSQTAPFDLGMYHTGAIASIVTTMFQQTSAQVTIPWQFSDWRRNEPYTYVYLYLPFVGVIHIPSSQIIGESAIDVQIAFNQKSGEIAFRVYAGNVQIGAYGANTAVQIPVGSSQVTPAQKITALAGVAGGIGSAIASGNILGTAVAAASLASIRPIGATVGGIGGGAGGALDLNLRCITVCHNTSAEPNTIAPVIGTPTMAHHSLAQKTGYVQTQDASVSGSMTDTERQRINQLLDGGIYIE